MGNDGCAKTGWSSNETPRETDAVVLFTTAFFFRSLVRADNTTTRMNINKDIQAVARSRAGNANHHLWNNHGIWWCHITFHLPDFTKRRLRLSLDTQDLNAARQLRDALLALFGCSSQSATKEVV